ncbi:MAG: hypothetical protein A2508_02485 [Candidatus Lambdaproteobacteria bacterium RIFOXYD12_FULL_49_8]|nr:MAG: hypothetical protein A2508_02485 [Candidatus Lambdaproteobacteria bacterium RIFOXYD12_FULL_49_8]
MTVNKEEILSGIADAAERMGLETEDLISMIDEVLDDCINKVGRMREAAAAQDSAKLSAIGHDIKGSALNYGIVPPSAIAKDIEVRGIAAANRIDELDYLLKLIRGFGISE